MTEEKALEIASAYINDLNNKSIFVTSDHAVYLNSPLEHIQGHCERNGLTLVVIRNSEVKEAISKEVSEDETPKKKNKKQS